MRGTPWKALSVLSLLLTAAGGVLVGWSASVNVGWQGSVIGLLVIVIGILLTRMNYRAYRYAIAPSPGTTIPIVAVCACALLWIAFVVGVL